MAETWTRSYPMPEDIIGPADPTLASVFGGVGGENTIGGPTPGIQQVGPFQRPGSGQDLNLPTQEGQTGGGRMDPDLTVPPPGGSPGVPPPNEPLPPPDMGVPPPETTMPPPETQPPGFDYGTFEQMFQQYLDPFQQQLGQLGQQMSQYEQTLQGLQGSPDYSEQLAALLSGQQGLGSQLGGFQMPDYSQQLQQLLAGQQGLGSQLGGLDTFTGPEQQDFMSQLQGSLGSQGQNPEQFQQILDLLNQMGSQASGGTGGTGGGTGEGTGGGTGIDLPEPEPPAEPIPGEYDAQQPENPYEPSPELMQQLQDLFGQLGQSPADTLPGEMYGREYQQQANQALLNAIMGQNTFGGLSPETAGLFSESAQAIRGLQPGISNEQTQREISQFEQQLDQKGLQEKNALEARLNKLGVLTSGITGARGVDLNTMLQQERGNFLTNTLGELERRRFDEGSQRAGMLGSLGQAAAGTEMGASQLGFDQQLGQNQQLQSLLGQQFGQNMQDAQFQQQLFESGMGQQNQNLQMALSLLGMGDMGFPQGQYTQSQDNNASLQGLLGSLLGTGAGGMFGSDAFWKSIFG